MPNSLTVTIPIRTHSRVNGSHGHWSAAYKRTKSERSATWAALAKHIGVTPPAWCVLPLTVTFTRIAPQPFDDDNLRPSNKAVRDEITAWLGLKNDRVPGLEWRYEQRRGEPKTYAVEVTISQVTT